MKKPQLTSTWKIHVVVESTNNDVLQKAKNEIFYGRKSEKIVIFGLGHYIKYINF